MSSTLNPSEMLFNIIKDEVVVTKGAGKFIALAMFFNIPIYGFIPYLSQAITILLLVFFWKRVIEDNKNKKSVTKNVKSYRIMNKNGSYLIIGTMVFQLIWIPFITQLVTLVLLGIIYATMTSYKK